MTDTLLALLIILVLVGGGAAQYQARRQHQELLDLLNDLATMVGEAFDQRKD